MKLVKSSKSISDLLLNKSTQNTQSRTFQEERLAAEQAAVAHEKNRSITASKYPNAPTPEPTRAFSPDVNDHDKVINEATKIVNCHIAELFGKKLRGKRKSMATGECDITFDKFVSQESHKDKIDNSEITDKAVIQFAAKFSSPNPSKFKIAKFQVAFDDKSDRRFAVAGKFYDESDNEYELTSATLENFLKNAESEDVNTKKEVPIVYFHPEFSTYELATTVEPSDKVVARLISAGYKVERNKWIDRTYGPEFGRLCYCAVVEHSHINSFLKVAAMSDDEWFNRASEEQRTSPFKAPEGEWNDRALDKSHTQEEYKTGEQWKDRALDKNHGNPGNPYNSEAKMLFADGAKKPSEEKKDELKDKVVKPLEAKASASANIAKSIQELEDFLK